MFLFTLAKLLSMLVYPLGQTFALSFLALLFKVFGMRRSAFTAVFLAFAWLYVCSTSIFADSLMGALEEGYASRPMSVIKEADAIVLLGGAMRGYAHLGSLPDMNQQADRLVHAVELYKAGKSRWILVSGGSATGGRSEAEQIKDILLVMGVSRRDILMETQSLNTHENALFSAPILKAREFNKILLVTSAFHMRRAQALFAAQGGLQIVPAPTDFQRKVAPAVSFLPSWVQLPGVSNLYRTTHALHEIIGFAMYRWRGWL